MSLETEQSERPAPAKPAPTPADVEVKAIGRAYSALAPLDDPARRRALRWLSDRFDADNRRDHDRDPWNDEPPF